MKEIIIIAFIYFSYCQILYLEKYGTIKGNNSTGIICLNIEKFFINKLIHIQFNAINGKIDEKIYYEFKNNISDIDYKYYEYVDPINSMKSTFLSDSYSYLKRKTITKNYFYDIKKNVDAKYLIIKYNEATGDYLKIENTRINWGYMRVFFLVSIFVIVFLLLIISCCVRVYMKYKLLKRFNQTIYQVPSEISSQVQNVPTVSNAYSI